MKIKKIYAKDTRTAMRKMKAECGDDAVILSNRKTADGIEMIVAIDFDPNVINSIEEKLQPVVKAGESASGLSSNANGNLFQQNLAQAALLNKAKEEQQAQMARQVYAAQTQAGRHYSPAQPKTPKAKAKPQPQTRDALRNALAELIVMAAPKDKPKVKKRSRKATDEARVAEGRVKAFNNNITKQISELKARTLSKTDVINLQKPILQSIRSELSSLGSLMQDQMEFMGWGRWSDENPKHANLLRQLTAIGLDTRFCKKIIDNIQGEVDADKAWRRALGIWAHHLNVREDTVLTRGGVYALIGPTGVGKTTTIAKMAARFAATHGRKSVLIISNDNQRMGAHEQLQSLGRTLGITVMPATSVQELHDILSSVRRSKKLILIDRSGICANDSQEKIEKQLRIDKKLKIERMLVLSCNAEIGSLENTVRRYKKLNIKGCVLTKLDEAASLGGVLTVAAHHKLPITYITNGIDIPKDILVAKVPYLLSKAVALSNCKQAKPDEVTMAMRFGRGVTRQAV